MKKVVILFAASLFFWACTLNEPGTEGNEGKTTVNDTGSVNALAAVSLKVRTYQSGPVVQNQVYEKITLVNTGTSPIALTSIKVRYYFAYQGSTSYGFACDYTSIGTSYVKGAFAAVTPAKTGAEAYNEISFSGPSGALLNTGSSLELQCRIWKNDWTTMDNSKNYSFNVSTSLSDNANITAFVDNTLVWGNEPGGSVSSTVTSSVSSAQPVSSSSLSSLKSSLKSVSSMVTSVSSIISSKSSSKSSSPAVSSSSQATGGAVKIQTAQNGSVIQNQLNERFLIVNTGTSPLSLASLKIRYYFTYQGTTSYGFSCDYSPLGSANVKGVFAPLNPAKTGADAYNEISFTASAGSLNAGASVELQCRIWKTDWSNIDNSKNYSYNPLTSYSDCTKVTATLNGNLVWGNEPGDNASTSSATGISSSSKSSSSSIISVSSSSTGSQASVEDRQFPGIYDKATLISKARAMTTIETKAMIRKQVDEHWDLIHYWLELETKEKAYALFFGDATRECAGNDPELKFMSGLETAIADWGQNSAHAYGPFQTAETAYDCPDLWPQTQETNVSEMTFYVLQRKINGQMVYYPDVFYDPGISVHMGIRKFIHFAKWCKLGQYPAARAYSGVEIIRHTLAAHNTGWPEANEELLKTYSDEVGAAAKFYLEKGHLYDNVVTYTGDPQLERTAPWSWF